MAYDPKDPADKKIVDDAVAAALAEAAEEHATEVEGLKAKRTELLAKIAELRKDKGGDVDVSKLEGELETTKADLAKATKDLKKANDSVAALTTERDGATKNLTTLLVDQGLTTALTEVKVDPKYLPAVKALLVPQVVLKDDGNERKAFVGDKPLGEFVKAWSQGDEGKAYVSAAGNSGGGAGGPQGGNRGTGTKTMSREAYEAADQPTRQAFFAEGGTLTE
jgi:hypothetical protein